MGSCLSLSGFDQGCGLIVRRLSDVDVDVGVGEAPVAVGVCIEVLCSDEQSR